MATVSQQEVDAIYNRWLGLTIEEGIQPETLIKYGVAFVLLMLLFAYWVYRMKREISIRKAAEMREQSRSQIMEMLAIGAPLEQILHAIVKSVEQLNPSMLCSIMLLDQDSKHLLSVAGPSLPDFYNDAINGIEIGDGVGSCGTAVFNNKLVIVEDISSHPYWALYKDLAAKARLAACWSHPIRSASGKVLGAFGIYHHQRNRPSKLDIATIQESSRLASVAIERKQTEDAAKAAEKNLNARAANIRFILENSPIAVRITSLKTGQVKFANQDYAKMTNLSLDALIGVDPRHYYANPQDYIEVIDTLERGERVTNKLIEIINFSDPAKPKWTLASYMIMTFDDEPAVLAWFYDVTDSKLTENELRIAATAFESQEGIVVTDAKNHILRVNSAFRAITGYSSEEVVGQTPAFLSSGRHDEAFYEAMWEKLGRTGTWDGEIWNRRKNGDVYPEYLTITAVKDEHGVVTNYVATLTDITLSKAASEEIKNLAFFDPLTNLPNRRLLMDRLKQALASSSRSRQRGALLFLDLDHFKDLNDSLGHDIGDLLLKQVAERLVSCVREGDTVARLGGDEFVVLLEDLSEEALEAASQTEVIAQKILNLLNEPYQLSIHKHYSTPSIGVALFNDHETGLDAIIKQADIAMYQSKNEGRNTIRFFDPKMQEAITARIEMEQELRNAIEQQQFQLYYQLQVDAMGRALGAEALIRWNHPDRGMISPFNFIPLAEETDLILPIGSWVLDAACAQLKVWESNIYTSALEISVNVSAKQFNQQDFVKLVQSNIQKHAINPRLLKFELTESMLVDNLYNTIINMVALQVIGVRFELDDFGTGYSSLQYLKQLPLYQLKIDQSFVRDIESDDSDRLMIHTIINMAKNLNLEVIAEGVETEAQRQFLLESGCTHFQGYLFAKPLPISDFENMLSKD